MADASEGTMKQILSVPHAEAGPDRAEQTVSVHGLAGSDFELDVNSAERGWEVAEHFAARAGHPAWLLVLISGGYVIDPRQLLLYRVQHNETSYVVRRFGAGRVAV